MLWSLVHLNELHYIAQESSLIVSAKKQKKCYHAAIPELARKQDLVSARVSKKKNIPEFIAQNTNAAGRASMHSFASYMPMHWHVHDILDARTIRIALDVAPPKWSSLVLWVATVTKDHWGGGQLRPSNQIGDGYQELGVCKTGHCVRATYVKWYSDNRAYLKVSHYIICLWSVHMRACSTWGSVWRLIWRIYARWMLILCLQNHPSQLTSQSCRRWWCCDCPSQQTLVGHGAMLPWVSSSTMAAKSLCVAPHPRLVGAVVYRVSRPSL